MQHISPQGEGRQVYGKGGQAGTLVSATQRNEMLCGSAKGCICGVPHRNGAAAGAARATYVDRAMTPPPQPQDCLPYLASPPAPVAPRQAFSALLLPSSPCHALPCPSLPYPALPCRVLPYPIRPYPTPTLSSPVSLSSANSPVRGGLSQQQTLRATSGSCLRRRWYRRALSWRS